MCGEIYPDGYKEFTVAFQPSASTNYVCMAFCAVEGRSTRQALRLKGRGIGPTAVCDRHH